MRDFDRRPFVSLIGNRRSTRDPPHRNTSDTGHSQSSVPKDEPYRRTRRDKGVYLGSETVLEKKNCTNISPSKSTVRSSVKGQIKRSFTIFDGEGRTDTQENMVDYEHRNEE